MRDNYERDEGFFNRKWLEITACVAGWLSVFPVRILTGLAQNLWLLYACGFFYVRKRYIMTAVFVMAFVALNAFGLFYQFKMI